MVLLASLGVQSFLGTIYVWWAQTANPAWEQVGYASFVRTMNAIAAPQVVLLVVAMGLCVPKRLFSPDDACCGSRRRWSRRAGRVAVTGSLPPGWRSTSPWPALIQVAVVVLTAAGAKGPSYLTEGRLTKLG